ncbi:MAG TPA: hypothetical protein VIS53_06905 [Candidatus Udaeobacter sp.]
MRADKHEKREGAPCFRSNQQQCAAIKWICRSVRRRPRVSQSYLWRKYIDGSWLSQWNVKSYLLLGAPLTNGSLIGQTRAAGKMNDVSWFGRL